MMRRSSTATSEPEISKNHRRRFWGIFVTMALFLGAFAVSGRGVRPAPHPQPAASPRPSPQKAFSSKSDAMMDQGQPIFATFSGHGRALGSLQQGQAKPLAMATADFNGDGIGDLVVGYSSSTGGTISLHLGNIDAFAPRSHASWQAIGESRFPAPFLAAAQATDTPVSPDLVVAGDFNGDGNADVAIAANGGNAFYLLAGDGHGNFAPPQVFSVAGTITTLAGGHLGATQTNPMLVVSFTTTNGPELEIYNAQAGSLVPLVVYPLPQAATEIAFGNLEGDQAPDLAIVAGGNVYILHGSDLPATPAIGPVQGSANDLESVSLPFPTTAIALGRFVSSRDGRTQMALLSSSGSVNVVASGTVDTTPLTPAERRAKRIQLFKEGQNRLNGVSSFLANSAAPSDARNWQVIDTIAGSGQAGGSAQNSRFVSTYISGHPLHDLAVMDSSSNQVHVFSHSGHSSAIHSLSVNARGSLVAMLPMRVNIDGRPGMVVLSDGQTTPTVMMPLPDPTYFVNTTNDPAPGTTANNCNNTSSADLSSSCSLRQAVIKANSINGNDTIMVPRGTYQLTIPLVGGVSNHDATTGRLDILDGVSIVGENDSDGKPDTIIEAGDTNSDGIDKVFSVNPNFDTAFATSFSNLEIRFGHNAAPYYSDGFAGDGFGAGIDWEASDTGTLTITNCNIHDNTATDGAGAGLFLTNSFSETGGATISQTTIASNTAKSSMDDTGAQGGGIFSGFTPDRGTTPATITSSIISGNTATNGGSAGSVGGGIASLGGDDNPYALAISGSTISGNSANLNGGGISTLAPISVDTSTISNNTAGKNGGGVYTSACGSGGSCIGGAPSGTKISHSNLTGNNAIGGSGGGVFEDGADSVATLSYNRIVGNEVGGTTGVLGAGVVSNDHGTATATNNWWGCNSNPGPSLIAGCDNMETTNSGTETHSPWLMLDLSSNPTTVGGGATSTLTASFLKNSNGSSVGATDLAALVGVGITFNATGGSISNANIGIQSSGTATATFTNSSICVASSASATVDSAIVSLTFNTGCSSMTANAGTTPQSAMINNAFTNPLAVTVKDSNSNPVAGVPVTFTAPGAGASGTFSNGTATITVNTNASGVASAPFTANSTVGGPYMVSAAVTGLTTVNFSLTNTAGAASSMTANAGTTPQSTAISTAFTNALAVTVKDAGSNPVSGVNVTFTAPGSGASGKFSNNTATITVVTNGSGIASTPFTANSTVGGPYTVTAAASGLATVNFSLTNTTGAASSMTANAGTTPQSAAVTTAFTNALAVTVKDAGSNPVSGVSVTFTAPGSGASGTFSNNIATITVATNASGIASAPFSANSTVGGPYTVTAAASGLTTVNFSLTNTAGAPASMTANAGTTPQSTAINTAFTNALAVTVKDAGSNPVSGVSVTFTAPVTGASGKFSNSTATITVATNASGVASAPFTANSTAGGPYAVTAAVFGLTTVNFSLTNSVGAAASITANAGTTPQSATISTAFTNALAVTVKDAGSNPVSGVSVTFAAPGTGASGIFSNSTAVITVATNASGIASAPFTANSTAGGPYTVTATALGLTTANFSLTNSVGAAASMAANAGTTPQSATVFTSFTNSLAVTVKDSGSNPVSGVNVTFTAPSLGASGVFSNSSTTITVPTNASGIVSAPFVANTTAGGYTVTAAASGLSNVNFSLTNTPGGATKFSVVAPSTAIPGTPFNFTVTARDQFMNIAGSYAGTIHFGSTDGSAVLPANYTFGLSDGGVHTFSATLNTGGTQTITATDTVASSVTGTSGPIVTSAAATFISTDKTTEGSWMGVYGADGYDLANGLQFPSGGSLPYGTYAVQGQTNYTWPLSVGNPTAALETDSVGDRVAATWYNSSTFSLDVNLTDGKQHQVALYLLDYDNKGRNETIQLKDTSSGNVLDTRIIADATTNTTSTNFVNGSYLIWNVSGHITITVTRNSGPNAVVAGIFFGGKTVAVAPPAATFTGSDTSTQGNWIGTYGADGYWVDRGGQSLPSYDPTLAVKGENEWTWAQSTSDVRAAETGTDGTSSRIAASWYNSTPFTFDVNVIDGQTHQVALYVIDWDNQARNETIEILDANSNAILDQRIVPDTSTSTTAGNFVNGIYLRWNISGHVTIKVIANKNPNAVVAGIFFGGAGSVSSPPPPATASWLNSDTTTQGAWIGKYGTQGYILANAGQSNPLPGTFVVQNQLNWTWEVDHTPVDPRDLETDTHGDTLAAAWYSTTKFNFDLNLTDGNTHQIALYTVDWDNKGRNQTITIADANTGTVLDTRVIPNSAGATTTGTTSTSFIQGSYLIWNISGHVTISIKSNAGPNAVVSGVFIDP
jgi:hypothetical protein